MRKIVWPRIFILVGILFLSNSLGFFSWSTWSFLWRFWPIVLVLAGLRLIFSRFFWTKFVLISLNLIIAGSIFSLFLAWTKPAIAPHWLSFRKETARWSKEAFPQERKQEFIITDKDYPNLSKKSVTIDLDFGQLDLSDQRDSPNLFWLFSQYQYPFGVPQVNTDLIQKEEKIIINFSNYQRGVVPPNRLTNKMRYQTVLGKTNLPLQLTLNTNIGQAQIHLKETPVEKLTLGVGTGKAKIELSKFSLPQDKLIINLEAGEAEVTLPAKTKIKLHYSLETGRINLNEERLIESDQSKSLSFGQNDWPEVIIEARVGSGALTIKNRQ